MKVRILYGYRGKPSNEQYIEPGEHDLPRAFVEYLVANGHAVAIDEPKSDPAPKQETKSKSKAKENGD